MTAAVAVSSREKERFVDGILNVCLKRLSHEELIVGRMNKGGREEREGEERDGEREEGGEGGGEGYIE